jgi:hypothetical protein
MSAGPHAAGGRPVTISAEIILDSIGPHGIRLTTMQLYFPRVILAEWNTHRQLSKNASSSRAIPWYRMREWILRDPYLPIHFGLTVPGMQSRDEACPESRAEARRLWLEARDLAIHYADRLWSLRLHKQVINRLVEPFGHVHVVVSATDFANFFALRIHEDAMPELQALAVAMARALAASTPTCLRPGEWHLPYVTEEDWRAHLLDVLLKVSTARCARVSYRSHEGKVSTVEEDLRLFDRLLGADPKHASPAEHQARCLATPEPSGNFTGWKQHRKQILGECAGPEFDWRARLAHWEGVDFIV